MRVQVGRSPLNGADLEDAQLSGSHKAGYVLRVGHQTWITQCGDRDSDQRVGVTDCIEFLHLRDC